LSVFASRHSFHHLLCAVTALHSLFVSRHSSNPDLDPPRRSRVLDAASPIIKPATSNFLFDFEKDAESSQQASAPDSSPSDFPHVPSSIPHFTMRISATVLLAAAAATLTSATRSSKRGLVFVPSEKHPTDNQIWVGGNSDLTWYYNYQVAPSPAYSNRTQSEFEFVPMLWSPTTTFLSQVKTMISGGRNITHILTYNEPDGTSSTGGSNVQPAVAAANWISQVEPLRKLGVKTGAPAVTGSPSGFTWLQMFFDACHSQGTNCTADFFPVHWYGNFEGLASHVGQVAGTYVLP
jgi:hypothetical protein